MKMINGLLILLGGILIIVMAAHGTTVEDSDATPALILIPLGVQLIRAENRAKRKPLPASTTGKRQATHNRCYELIVAPPNSICKEVFFNGER